jgi:sigma-B regulation protein RsbU (phosphoserine phosphatase)
MSSLIKRSSSTIRTEILPFSLMVMERKLENTGEVHTRSVRDITRERTAESSLLDERSTSDLREQFVAVLGHDLRNPLAAIGAGVRLLRRSNDETKKGEVLALMESSVSRMANLIDNVMDFARGRLGGGFGVEFGDPEQAEPILSQVISELKAAHPGRTIEFEIDAPDLVIWDRGRIGQLVSNLVANAITHGALGQPVRVSATSKGLFELAVLNRGAEIPPQLLDKIFKPFTRGEARADMKGLGLGLYISNEIAKAHGGTLEVHSSPGETTFTFRMPLKPREDSEP